MTPEAKRLEAALIHLDQTNILMNERESLMKHATDEAAYDALDLEWGDAYEAHGKALTAAINALTAFTAGRIDATTGRVMIYRNRERIAELLRQAA